MLIKFILTVYFYLAYTGATLSAFLLAVFACFIPALRNTLHLLLAVYGRLLIFFSGCRIISHKPDINKKKAYLIISNHQSLFDIMVIYSLFYNFKFKWIIKKSLFYIPFFGFNLWAADYINLDRENKYKAYRAIKKAINFINNKTSIVIFPEGTRSLTDIIQEFKAGSFMIAYHTKVCIIPVILKNTLKIKSKKSFLINPLPIKVKILDPVDTKNLSKNKQKELLTDLRNKMLKEYKKM